MDEFDHDYKKLSMIEKIDFSIFCQCANFCDWMDYRWHINNYRLAAYAYRVSGYACATISVTAWWVTGTLWLKTIIMLMYPIIAYFQLKSADKLMLMSRQYERNPDAIPSGAVLYWIMPPWRRIMGLGFGIELIAINIPGIFLPQPSAMPIRIADTIAWGWMSYEALGMYFAMKPPWQKRKRKEKKSFDWSFGLMPSPVGSKS